jgi:hypothetical protein
LGHGYKTANDLLDSDFFVGKLLDVRRRHNRPARTRFQRGFLWGLGGISLRGSIHDQAMPSEAASTKQLKPSRPLDAFPAGS